MISTQAATAGVLLLVARRAANNVEAPRLLWTLAEHLRARVETTFMYRARVAAVVVRLAIRRDAAIISIFQAWPLHERTPARLWSATPPLAFRAAPALLKNALHDLIDLAVGFMHGCVQRFVFLGGRRDAASVGVFVDDLCGDQP